MAARKQKWHHVVTQPCERKSKTNSTKTQQKQNALAKILTTTKKMIRSTCLRTTCSNFRPLQRPLTVRRLEEPRELTLLALCRFLKWGVRIGAGRKEALLLFSRPANHVGAPHHSGMQGWCVEAWSGILNDQGVSGRECPAGVPAVSAEDVSLARVFQGPSARDSALAASLGQSPMLPSGLSARCLH